MLFNNSDFTVEEGSKTLVEKVMRYLLITIK